MSLANSALTAGSYANANTIVVITTNSYGDITGVSNTAISILPTQINRITGTDAAVLNTSPTFAGAPLAPTAVSGTSNTMIATTEFVQTSNTGLKSYVDLTKAPLASPTFAGAPLAPTAASGTSNTMIATTAFVTGEILAANTLTSPTLTGQPLSPTAASGTSNTMIATTAFVADAVANTLTSNVQFMSIGVGTASSGVSGEIRATNNITAYYSDERLKTNLGPIENALEKVNSLNGFYHEANELAQSLGYTPVREVGVSAQEVQAVLPEVVAPAPIDDRYLTVRYERLVPLLIEAIKELNTKVNDLQKQLNGN